MIRENLSAVLERATVWHGSFETEPYEAGWASEAIFFIRTLSAPAESWAIANVQVSPDGIHWCNEGAVFPLPTAQTPLTFCRVAHFGSWLRLVGQTAQPLSVIVYLNLKA